MKRIIEKSLKAWGSKSHAKPLLLLGARQVGKTWLMKKLGQKHFKNFIYINFEKESSYKNIFDTDLNIDRILETLSLITNEKIIESETLIIFDEIQNAPKALTSLKYFHEDRPNLHVIAAGSLLGVTLDLGSFPVGKVEFINIYPMSFEEFLMADDESGLFKLLEKADFNIISAFHDKYIHALRTYYLVGGMPEAVSTFLNNKSNFAEVKQAQNNILKAYLQDFAKHAPSSTIPKIISVWESLVSQLAKENKKFIYGLLKSGARAREYESAIDWLVNYGLINKIHAVNKVGFPLKSYRDLKSFKLYILDVGLLSNLANLHPNVIIDNNSFFKEFKGALTEQFVQQELTFSGIEHICYWSKTNGLAELDFLFDYNGVFYPLEVKAAENLHSKSLSVFHEKYPKIHCFRTSLSKFRKEEWMTNIPLYAIGKIMKLS